jgi:hypothetical protein
MIEAKTHCYGWRQTRQDNNNKKLGRNRGIPKTQRVLAWTKILWAFNPESRGKLHFQWHMHRKQFKYKIQMKYV